MEAIKKIAKAVSVICLAATVMTEDVKFAVMVMVFGVVALGIELNERRK